MTKMKAIAIALLVLCASVAVYAESTAVDTEVDEVDADEMDVEIVFAEMNEVDEDTDEVDDEVEAEAEDESEEADEEADEAEEEVDAEDEVEAEVESDAELESFMEEVARVQSTGACACSQAQTQINEGVKPCCYKDTKGIATIGVGHNLKTGPSAVSALGLNVANIISTCGKYKTYTAGYCLTPAQINSLFAKDYAPAVACAKKLAPGAPACVAATIADMAFNMGCPGVGAFHGMLAAVKAKNWKGAATGAQTSKWYKQVGARAKRDVACLAAGQ